jgi:release factor glutamine methyltransferase
MVRQMTYGEAYREGIQILKRAGTEAPANDAGVLLCYAAGCDRTFIYVHGDEYLEEVTERAYLELLERRADGYPLQYLTGVQEFMSLKFEVRPGVLIPRQDTELLAETVLDHCNRSGHILNVLDLCTGSGCIAVSLAYHCPSLTVTASDIMPDALQTASVNALKNGVSDRITFIESDLFGNIPKAEFDVIVSNPPYIRTGDIPGLQAEVRDFEPTEALDGGADGLRFYRSIIGTSPLYLKSGGLLAFETGYDQAAEVASLMAGSGNYDDIRIYKDLAGIDRVVAGLRR